MWVINLETFILKLAVNIILFNLIGCICLGKLSGHLTLVFFFIITFKMSTLQLTIKNEVSLTFEKNAIY